MRRNVYVSCMLSLIVCLLCSRTVLANDSTHFRKSPIDVTPRLSTLTQSLAGLNPFEGFNLSSATFSPYFLAAPTTATDSAQQSQIEVTFKKVTEENRFVDFLDAASLVEFPIGIKTDIGFISYTILLDSVVMTPRESFLFASMVFETPQGHKLYFKGEYIGFSKSGGIAGSGKLLLIGNYNLPIAGNNQKLVIRGDTRKTFVEFDCNGYKQFSLEAQLVFSNELLIPEQQPDAVANGNVEINISTTFVDWGDIIVTVSVPPFQIRGINDVSFSVREAALDLSDTRNPLGIIFPKNYEQHLGLTREVIDLWQGVFLKQVTITLPPQFKTKDDEDFHNEASGHRISFHALNLIIDHIGVSGQVSATNVIPIEKGKLSKWRFSLDSLSIHLSANHLQKGSIAGLLEIPIAANNNSAAPRRGLFKYTAAIREHGQYIFNVVNTDTLEFDLWKAQVQLKPSSYVEIKVNGDNFLPKANLHGVMMIAISSDTSGNDSDVKFNKIVFENLVVQSTFPFVSVGSFSLGTSGSSSSFNGFPLQVRKISGSSVAGEIRLNIDLSMALVGEADGGFAGEGRVTIVSSAKEINGLIQFKLDRVDVSRFAVNIAKGPFRFKGALTHFKKDNLYGDGINGTLQATFGQGIELSATAIFGCKGALRYWLVDGLAVFSQGIPIVAPLECRGFGGGAYFHMKNVTTNITSPLARTASGRVYVPDENTHLGLMAIANVGVGAKTFSGQMTYEMNFNSNGGVKTIALRGNGYFMSNPLPIDATKLQAFSKKFGHALIGESNNRPAPTEEIFGHPSASRAQLYATVAMHYDFDNRTLHANLIAFVNAGGGNIRGTGPQMKAGEAVIHFGPSEWYIYIGRPERHERVGIEVLGFVRLDAYFVAGSVIPDFPAPPDKIAEILGPVHLQNKDLNAMKTGRGVGFGASFGFNTGNLSFLVFYAKFAAEIGADVQLRDYGNVECAGRGTLGIDGWYAQGQAYAWMEGTIGIRVRVMRKRRKVHILDIAAACLAQASLPNPVVLTGYVGGKFNVLGGLVKGSCRFLIQIGKECQVVRDNDDSALEGTAVIAQLTPGDHAREIDVFTLPQAVLNYEAGKAYEFVDEFDRPTAFKIELDRFVIKHNGKAVAAQIQWNDDHTVAALRTDEILPANSKLSVEVQTSFKEKTGGQWVTSTSDGQKLIEARSAFFETADAPVVIPPENIEYSYPMINQFNFYQKENPTGYIRLKHGQAYLFNDKQRWSYSARFISSTGNIVNEALRYSEGSKTLDFSIPPGLANGSLYYLQIVASPVDPEGNLDQNVDTVSTLLASSDPDLQLIQRTKVIRGSLTRQMERRLYQHAFRTSVYNTFLEKVRAASLSNGWSISYRPDVHLIGSNYNGKEPFSFDEIYSTNERDQLIRMEAKPNSWLTYEIEPLIYRDYGKLSFMTIQRRDVNELGIVPVRGVSLYQVPHLIELTDQMIANNVVPTRPFTGRLDYNLSYYIYLDLVELSSNAANYVVRHGDHPRAIELVLGKFPVMRSGIYQVEISYVLPGRSTPSSSFLHSIHKN